MLFVAPHVIELHGDESVVTFTLGLSLKKRT
jgi:hypothetical protein